MAVDRSRARRAALLIVVLVSLAVRLHGVGFGLPSLYDPDEPIFMVIAAKLLSGHTLNPGWFGHPGSTTIYLIALIDVLVYAGGALTGRFSSVSGFIHAAYADPTFLFLPARIVMALLGTGCVALTYLIGRRVQGTATGLLAALLLSLNALHIAWSQVIRTDVHASLFMLASLLFALRFAADGKLRDLILASLFAGFATATKWPAITAVVAIAGASAYRLSVRKTGIKQTVSELVMAGAVTVGGLFIASPFVFLDYRTVLANISGEARPFHLGHTGGGLLSNLLTYARSDIAPSMGWFGLVFCAGGALMLALRRGPSRWTLLPVAVAFLLLIGTQRLIWSRWLVPELPFLCIFAAAMAATLAELAARRWKPSWRPAFLAAFVALVVLPTSVGAVRLMNERANDTRAQAAAWVVAHVPPGKTVVLEHLELSLRSQPDRFLFPMGTAGCLDGRLLLGTNVGYQQLDALRNGSPIIDLGNVAPGKAETCRADFAILTYYDLYRIEAEHYPRQLSTYAKILSGGRTVALFRPEAGRAGGPFVRIVAMPPKRS